MRNAVIKAIEHRAEKDARLIVITADVGYGVLDSFSEKFPSRFYNMGISEQLMASAAAGMALCGNIVCTYSIGNFATLRCIEQIRNDICYHNANVKIIAVGGGFSYGQLGMSHHATEDIAMMRALPNMKVFVPADPNEALDTVEYALETEGPCYIRLARQGEPILYDKARNPEIVKVQMARPGTDVALIACGPVLKETIRASKILEEQYHRSAAVFSVPCIKPLDVETIVEIAGEFPLIISVEEHQVTGGLGGAIAEAVSAIDGPHAHMRCLGLPDEYTSMVGSHDYLCRYYGLDGDAIAGTVSRLLR